MNKELIKQVREGKASIEFINSKHLVYDLNRVAYLATYVKNNFSGLSRYYFFINGKWSSSDTNPTDLTPRPLDRFFEGEEVIGTVSYDPVKRDLKYDFSSPPTPEQPSLPEGKDANYYVLEIGKWAGKYEISFQFWGENNNNCFIAKDGVDLWSAGGEGTPIEIMALALNYIHKINRVKNHGIQIK